MITKEFLQGTDDLRDAFFIRTKVFIEEQNVPESIEMDAYDKTSEHIVVYENGKPIATGRLVFKEGQYSIGRVAVLKEHRSKGIGAVVVSELKNLAMKKKATEVHIHAQLYAQDFYEKLGFQAYGDVFEEAGIEHISMAYWG